MSTRRHSRGQALVETALALPLLLTVVLGMFETSRLAYIRSVLESNARTAAIAAAIDQTRSSDCAAWRAGTDPAGGSVAITVDPASQISEFQAAKPTNVPGPNQGFLYIYPAAAQDAAARDCNGCPSSINCSPCDSDSAQESTPQDPDAAEDNAYGQDCGTPLGSTGSADWPGQNLICVYPSESAATANMNGDEPNVSCPMITVYETFNFVPIVQLPGPFGNFLIKVCVTERIQGQSQYSNHCNS